MPIYEYECTGCHHRFDALQKIHEEPVQECPVCFKSSVVRLVSATSFQLKGTGWYATDFKDKKNNKNQEKAAPQESAASGDTGTPPKATTPAPAAKSSLPVTDTTK